MGAHTLTCLKSLGMLCRLTWPAVAPNLFWWLTGLAGIKHNPLDRSLANGQYFDLQASNAFAHFEYGPAVSTGPRCLLKPILVGDRSSGNH
jgi:hypothetical protein